MNYGAIKNNDIANGLGIRVSLFVSGCSHHCPGCFNKESWDEDYGTPYTNEVQMSIINMLGPRYIAGLSLLGGEPMEPEHQKSILSLLTQVRDVYGNSKDVWLYSGYTLKDITEGKAETEYTREILKCVHYLVDGPFIEKLKDPSLKFRGSSNQRIINIQKWLDTGQIEEYK